MNKNIKTIQQASFHCVNNINATGELKELSIKFSRGDEDKVFVSYIGVVKINDSYVRIYGKTNNSLNTFLSTITELRELKANIYAEFNNDEITETRYSDHCSLVYVSGRISSYDSINVDYISNTRNDCRTILASMVGVPIEVIDNKKIKILVITNDYHHIITMPCRDCTDADWLYKTMQFNVCVDKSFFLIPIGKTEEQIEYDVIKTAIQEHNMYMKTWQNQK